MYRPRVDWGIQAGWRELHCVPVVVKKTILYLLNSYSLSLSIHHGYVAAPFSSPGIYLVNMVTRVVMLTCPAPKKSKMSLGDFLADESM